MPKFDASRNHSLSLDEAKNTVEKIVEDIQSSYPNLVDTIDWNKDRTEAKVKGKMFKGDFAVNSSSVQVHINLSMLAKPFMGKIKDRINAKLDQYFG